MVLEKKWNKPQSWNKELRCKYQRPKSLQLRVAFVATEFTLYCLSEIRIKVDILSHYYKHL